MALAPVEAKYNNLMQIETDYNIKENLRFFVNRNNNSFHDTMKTLSDMLPESFRIESIQSDDKKVTISAKSRDKLSSLTALQIQMNKIPNIKSAKIDAISENKEQATNRRIYTYTLTFEYVQSRDDNEEISPELQAALDSQGGGQ